MENDKTELIYNTLKENLSNKITYSEKNKSICLKGIGYSLTLFHYIKPFNKAYRYSNKICKTTILLYCKIPLKTLEKRIANALNKLGINKDLIESFCLEIREQLEKVSYQYDLPKKKRKIKATKKLAHIEKKAKFHITNYKTESSSNASMDIGFMNFMYLYQDIKKCKIIDKKSLINGYKLTKLSYGNNLRIHQCRYSFNNVEWNNLHSPIRDKNLTIWSPNAQSIMLSIGSKQDKELCNLELLSEGFRQIAKRYTFSDTLRIVNLLRKKEVNIELGIDVLSPEEEIRNLGFGFLPKTYKIYGIKFWFDKSRNSGIELDFSFNSYLTDIVKALKLIELFKKNIKSFATLYEKGINEIIPFDIAPKPDLDTCLENDFAYIEKVIYEIKDLSILAKLLIIDTSPS